MRDHRHWQRFGIELAELTNESLTGYRCRGSYPALGWISDRALTRWLNLGVEPIAIYMHLCLREAEDYEWLDLPEGERSSWEINDSLFETFFDPEGEIDGDRRADLLEQIRVLRGLNS